MATLFTGIFLQGSVSETYFRGILLYTGSVVPFAIGGAISGVVFMPKFYQMELKSVYQVFVFIFLSNKGNQIKERYNFGYYQIVK